MSGPVDPRSDWEVREAVGRSDLYAIIGLVLFLVGFLVVLDQSAFYTWPMGYMVGGATVSPAWYFLGPGLVVLGIVVGGVSWYHSWRAKNLRAIQKSASERTPVEAKGPKAFPTPPSPPAASRKPPASADEVPAWPMVPLTAVESEDARVVLRMGARSGLSRDKILVLATELPAEVSVQFGLAGAEIWRIARVEGDRQISPNELDRIGHLIETFLGQESGRAVILGGLELLADSVSVAAVRRLLQITREVAQNTRGAVVYHLDPRAFPADQLRMLEEGSTVIRFSTRAPA